MTVWFTRIVRLSQERLVSHAARRKLIIDGMQFGNWSEQMFLEMQRGGVSALHVTVAYHENFRDTVDLLIGWNERFRRYSHLIAFAGSGEEIDAVIESGRTAILFGLQNPSAIEADIGLVQVLHQLGIRFMQLSYNNQSLLCTGWTEKEDTGLTNMGREVIREMNRVGMIVDMSHSAERSTFEAIDHSERPIVISHANPISWRNTARNKSDDLLKALAKRGGMLGFSLYPVHMEKGSNTTVEDFARMAARTAELMGADRIGIGSDLCQDQPPRILAWMREGKWKHASPDEIPFPAQPAWFRTNLDFGNVAQGLRGVGFSDREVDGILGRNWYDFLKAELPALTCTRPQRKVA
jgi:microsomal dipeptidase-like Zn-dependent dipeptidase